MNLKNRVKKLEGKNPFERKIIVISFQSEITELSFGDEKFFRFVNESEPEFIERVESIVEKSPERPYVTFLVSNI